MEAEEIRKCPGKHNIILENREILNVGGVKEVSGFNDENVLLITDLGELTISGEKLHISKFSQETGELLVDGIITSLNYSENKKAEGGFLKKLFR